MLNVTLALVFASFLPFQESTDKQELRYRFEKGQKVDIMMSHLEKFQQQVRTAKHLKR